MVSTVVLSWCESVRKMDAPPLLHTVGEIGKPLVVRVKDVLIGNWLEEMGGQVERKFHRQQGIIRGSRR